MHDVHDQSRTRSSLDTSISYCIRGFETVFADSKLESRIPGWLRIERVRDSKRDGPPPPTMVEGVPLLGVLFSVHSACANIVQCIILIQCQAENSNRSERGRELQRGAVYPSKLRSTCSDYEKEESKTYMYGWCF